MSQHAPDTDTDTSTDAFADRVFEASLAFVDALSIGIGDQLGWYDTLATHGPLTSRRFPSTTTCGGSTA
jgi:hypothetical protein